MKSNMTPKSPQELLNILDQERIRYQLFHHPPIHTVEDALRERGEIQGSYVKNLYLRDRRGEMLLVVCLNQREVNLQRLRRGIGYKRLSFASAERLMNDLGVRPGSVSPLALINTQPGALNVYADQALRAQTLINFHPLTNEMTVQLPLEDWIRLCEGWGFEIEWINFDRLPEEDS